jgi:ABC-type sulfate transport system permease component
MAVIVNNVNNALGRSAALLEKAFAYLGKERLQIALTVLIIILQESAQQAQKLNFTIGLGCCVITRHLMRSPTLLYSTLAQVSSC